MGGLYGRPFSISPPQIAELAPNLKLLNAFCVHTKDRCRHPRKRSIILTMVEKKKGIGRKVLHAGGWQIAKRVAKTVPFGGTAVVLFLVGSDIRKKGVIGGLINSGIDAIPFVGLAKNAVELVRGDFIRDKEVKHGER